MKKVGLSGFCTIATGVIALMGASAASANTDGQYGYTGRSGSCLECHGAQQYDGLQVEVAGTGDPISCWVVDEEASTEDNPVLMMLELKTLQFNQTVDVTITVADPAGQVSCPEADCCDCEGAACAGQDICGTEGGFFIDGEYKEQGECINFLNTCDTDDDPEDDPVAGFNVEVVGGGIFGKANADDDTVRIRENGGEVIPTEVTHFRPAYFDDGAVTWNLTYTAPAEADYEDAVQMWVGANVANGNGRADPKDLNSNYQATFALADRIPSFCAVCDDEGTLPDANGNCGAGCSHTGVPGGTAPLGAIALGLVGLAFVRRRR